VWCFFDDTKLVENRLIFINCTLKKNLLITQITKEHLLNTKKKDITFFIVVISE